MLTLVNSYKSLIQHFRFSVALVTNQKRNLYNFLVEEYSTNIYKKNVLSKYLQWDTCSKKKKKKDYLLSLFSLEVSRNFKLP